jgi:hypothetical protein
MIAIQTKFLAPTNNRGARIKAFTSSGFNVTISYPYASGEAASHFDAVKELVKKYKLDWNIEEMTYGGTETGYAFCFACSTVKGLK